MYLEKSKGGGLRIGVALCRTCTLYNPAHRTISHLQKECRTPVEKLCNSSSRPSQSSHIAYMWGFLCNDPRRENTPPSPHRHTYLQRENGLGKPFPRRRDDRDTHD